MTEHGPRTGAARDVPPPRPVRAAVPPPEPEDGGPLGRAARAVADAVGGLLGTAAPDAPASGSGPSAAAGLRDVLGALAGAAGAWRDRTASAAPPPDDRENGQRSPGAFLGDLLAAAAPRLPIRDGARLRAAYPGLTDDEIGEALVARYGRITAAVGAATGGLTAAQWLAPASMLALPLELGAETVLVAAVEVVLLGELHELHGRRAPGDARARAAAYLGSWSAQRAVDGTGRTGLVSTLTTAGLRSLSRRMGRRLTRGLPVAAPFLVGAAIAGRSNRRATETLARRVVADLRRAR
ncbi:hypothetical protein ACI797_06035 [Geodermatophilus sp. SYSU D00691]